MDVILFENFELPVASGVYCFVNLEDCFACSEYIKELKKYDTTGWSVIGCTKEERELIEKDSSETFPITRLYVNNKIEYEISGILYFSQIQNLYKVISSFDLTNNNNLKITALNDYKIASASQKTVNIQYFKVLDYLNVILLGKEIIAKKDQYVVMYPDGFIEVLMEEDFERRFN